MSSPPKALHGSLQYQPNLNYDAPDTDQMLRGEHNIEEDEYEIPKASWRTLIGFWISGMLNNFGYVVFLSAAPDLLKSATIPTAWVLLAEIVPGFIAQAVGPWFQEKIPYGIRVCFVVCCMIGSIVTAAIVNSVYVRLAGVVVGSIGSSFGEMTFLAYTSMYHKNTVSAWSSGTGAAGILGALVYWLLTGVAGFDYKTTLLVSSWAPSLIALMFFFVIEKAPVKVLKPKTQNIAPLDDIIDGQARPSHHSDSAIASMEHLLPSDKLNRRTIKKTDDPSIRFASSGNYFSAGNIGRHSFAESLPLLDQDDPLYGGNIQGIGGPFRGADDTMANLERIRPLSISRRLNLLLKLTPYMLPLGLVYFFEYLINQSVVPIFKYPDVWLVKNNQYQFLQLTYQVGVFLSRSSVNIYQIKSIWALQAPAVLQFINVVFLSFAAIYAFVPSFWLIALVVLWEGIMGGSIYINTFYLISEQFTGRAKEFCLGSTTQAYGFSITMAAVIGIFFQPFLEKMSGEHNTLFPTPSPSSM